MRISDWSSDVCSSDLLVVLGGRAPALRWGQGSLQEIDHVPFVAPLARFAATADSPDAAGKLIDDALRSEARRVGKECVRTGRSRWSPDPNKKKTSNR